MTARLPAISHQRMRVMCTQLHPILYMIWVHTIVKIWKSIESLLQVALFSKPYKSFKVISSSSLVCCNLFTWTNVYVGKGWANVCASSGRRISFSKPFSVIVPPPSACPPFHPASLLLQSMQLSLYRCMWRRCPVYYHTSQIWGMEKTHCRYNVDRTNVRPSPKRTPPPTLYMITYKPRVVDEHHIFSRFETMFYIITQMLKHLHLHMLYHWRCAYHINVTNPNQSQPIHNAPTL